MQGVFRHYVSPCRNKFLLEYLTLESDNNTGVSAVKRLGGFREYSAWGLWEHVPNAETFLCGWGAEPSLLRELSWGGGDEIPGVGCAPVLLCAGGIYLIAGFTFCVVLAISLALKTWSFGPYCHAGVPEGARTSLWQ